MIITRESRAGRLEQVPLITAATLSLISRASYPCWTWRSRNYSGRQKHMKEFPTVSMEPGRRVVVTDLAN